MSYDTDAHDDRDREPERSCPRCGYAKQLINQAERERDAAIKRQGQLVKENMELCDELRLLKSNNGFNEALEYRTQIIKRDIEEQLKSEAGRKVMSLRREQDIFEARCKLTHEIHQELNNDRVLRHSVNYGAVRWEDLPWSNVIKRIEKMQNLIRRFHTCCKV